MTEVATTGASSIATQPIDYAIWFALLGFVGALNSMTIYLINVFVIRIMNPAK